MPKEKRAKPFGTRCNGVKRMRRVAPVFSCGWIYLTMPPANRLVALDRDWRALDATWIEAPQQALFSALRERIDSGLREQSLQQQRGQRWLADAQAALTGLRQACTQAAAKCFR